MHMHYCSLSATPAMDVLSSFISRFWSVSGRMHSCPVESDPSDNVPFRVLLRPRAWRIKKQKEEISTTPLLDTPDACTLLGKMSLSSCSCGGCVATRSISSAFSSTSY